MIEYGILAAGGLAAWFSPKILAVSSNLIQNFSGMDPYVDIDVETATVIQGGKDSGEKGIEFLVSHDGSLGFTIEILGSEKYTGQNSWAAAVQSLAESLNSRFTRPGVSFQIVFQRDPSKAKRMCDAGHKPMYDTAHRLGLEMSELIKDRSQTISRFVEEERQYWSFWVQPSYLYKQARKDGLKDRAKEIKTFPTTQDIQNISMEVRALREMAIGTLKAAVSALKIANISHEVLDAKKALWVMRDMISTMYSGNFVPRLPFDTQDNTKVAKLSRALQPKQTRPININDLKPADILWPSLPMQILPETPEAIDQNTIRIGGMDHAVVSVKLFPDDFRSLNRFIEQMRDEKSPWRMSLRISGGGPAVISWKRAFASILAWDPTSPQNKKIVKAAQLVDARLAGSNVTEVQVSMDFCVWAPKEEPALLRSRLESLINGYQGMANAEIERRSNRSLRAFFETIPGLVINGTGNRSCLSLYEALSLAPLQRPASPWKVGEASMFFRSPDNKMLPFDPSSKLFNAKVTLLSGPMGYGKSNALSGYCMSILLSPGETEWPRISILETGDSQLGFVNLVREALPKEKRNFAQYVTITEDPSKHGINPFDLPLGAWAPLPGQESFLVNLLSMSSTNIKGDVAGFFQKIIRRAYKMVSPVVNGGRPKRYAPGVSREIDEALERWMGAPEAQGIKFSNANGEMTWYGLTDAFFQIYLKNNAHYEALSLAEKCQRFAVPCLADITGIPMDQELVSIYGDITVESGEKLPNYVSRMLQEMISKYPNISGPSSLSFGEARIIGMNIDKVCPKDDTPSSKLQTAIMTMVARQAVIGSWKVAPDEADLIRAGKDNTGENFPLGKEYRAYQRKIFQEIKDTRKVFIWDEYHRTSEQAGIRAQVETDIREGRKYEIWLLLASQQMDDFITVMDNGRVKTTLIDLASAILILGAGSEDSARKVCDVLGFDIDVEKIVTKLRKAGAEGSNMVAYYKTSKGNFVQYQYLNMGAVELWAYSTDPYDRRLREKVLGKLGISVGLKQLARAYPNGGCASDYERRKSSMQNSYGIDDEEEVGIIDKMAEEIFEYYEAHKND